MNFRNWFNRMVTRAAGATVREEGQTMVEYGLIIAVVALVVVGALILVGGQLSTTFNNIVTQLKTV
jgi:Flp/Fap pilin component.